MVPTVIDPDMLDTIGKNFRFQHGGGLAEWLKNALDNYLRRVELGIEPRPGAWPVYLNLLDAPKQSLGPNLAMVDFGGTTYDAIQNFFLRWGSRSAATLGKTLSGAMVTGGHGNGGKFYMREMWRAGARFLTFRDGKATSLVVEKRTDGNTGVWEFRDEPMTWREALDAALPEAEHLGGAAKLIAHMEEHAADLVAELDAGTRGLSVVVGRKAVQNYSANDVVKGGRWDHQKLVDQIKEAQQARRPIRELSISVFINGDLAIDRLSPDTIDDDPDWPVEEVEVPIAVVKDAALAGTATTAGTLRLRTAAEPLTHKRKHHNAVIVLEEHGNPIASYPVKNLPLPNHSPFLDYLHGELELTFPGVDDLVQNDRVTLVDSATSRAILEWVAERIWDRAAKIDKAHRESSSKADLEIAAILNDHLNKYARRFLQQLETEMFVDMIKDPTGGGDGRTKEPRVSGEGGDVGLLHKEGPGGGKDGPVGPAPREHGGGEMGTGTLNGHALTGGAGEGGTEDTPGSAEKTRRPRFPAILLSNYDPDPATGNTKRKMLTERHPPVWQDDTDKLYNVWWINTQHVFAKEAFKAGPKSPVFKSYQLHMFRDVVQREVLRLQARRQQELSLDVVENELTEISNRFLAELSRDLVATLVE